MSIFVADDLIGSFQLTSSISAPSFESADTGLRVRFAASSRNIANVEKVKICIMTANGVKLFVGVYKTTSGLEKTFIQIPIVGQSCGDLAKSLNQIIGIEATVANNFFDASASSLIDTGFSNILDQFAYLSCNVNDFYASITNIRNSLQLFYTSVEPFSQQNNYNQSYGGYISTNQLFYGYPLNESMGIYDENAVVDLTRVNPYLSIVNLQKSKFLQINDEIIEVQEWRGSTVFISKRQMFDTPLRMHAFGSSIRPFSKNTNFDVNLGNNRTQYRCFALKNTHPTFIIKNLKLYSSLQDRNVNSQIKIALEIPASNFYSGLSASTGTTAFSVNSLKNAYQVDYFKNAPLQFTSGANKNQVRIVKSYLPSTGTIELSSRLPFDISIGDAFAIDPQSAVRMKSAFAKPIGSSVSDFFALPTIDNGLAIEDMQQIKKNANLEPNEVIYLWIERSIGPQSDEYIDNRLSLSFSFSGI